MITKLEYDQALEAHEESERTINQYHREQRAIFDERMNKGPVFTDDELRYAATARCKVCNAGLAYPSPGYPDAWFCSALLKGEHDKTSDVKHEAYAFIYWSMKSEDDCYPNAKGSYRQNGITTRPSKTDSKEVQ